MSFADRIRIVKGPDHDKIMAECDASWLETTGRKRPGPDDYDAWDYQIGLAGLTPNDVTKIAKNGRSLSVAVMSGLERLKIIQGHTAAREAARPSNTEPPEPNSGGSAEKISLQAMAVAVLSDHPEWTTKKIAEVVGCNRKTLERCEKFQNLRGLLEGAKASIPKGTKFNGDLEAWDEALE